MPTTICYQHEDGDLFLANADHVDAARHALHVRGALRTWEDVLVHDADEADLLAELFDEEWRHHSEVDGDLLPEDDDVRLAPQRSWRVDKLLTDVSNDHPPSLLADAPVDLPAGLDDLWHQSRVRGGPMAAEERYFPAEVADAVLRRLREAGVSLRADPYLTSPWPCLEGRCSCADASRPDADGWVATFPADRVLTDLWIGDGEHVPHWRFDTVVTVARELSPLVDPLPHAHHVVAPFVDSRFQPVDLEPFETAVRAVTDALLRWDTVLVRCQAGINRSALVVGEAMARLGWRRDLIVDLIRNRRPQALANPFFADVVRGVVDTQMQPVTPEVRP